MKLLFVTDQFPWPLNDGGNLRTWHILQGLCREHDVTLLAHQPEQAMSVTTQLPDNLRNVITVPKPPLRQRIIHNTRHMRLPHRPLFLLKNRSRPLEQAVEEQLAKESFHAVHFNHLDTACFSLMHDWRQVLVFDSHNCLSAMALQVARQSINPCMRWLFNREAKLLRAVEHDVCQRSRMSLVCSQNDSEQFNNICPNGSYQVIPNGVNADRFGCATDSAPEPDSIVFTGAMNYFPNEQAALFLCRKILPLLRNRGRRIRVYIVGKCPTKRVKALHSGDEVIVTGEVPDVRPFLERATAVVVPLRHGSGTRLKILEAFAMGKAVVSTRLGAEGIAAVDGRDILYADESTHFASQVMRVLGDEQLRRGVGQSARKLVEAEYVWPKIQRELCSAYSRL